ncbi:MAG: FKBP-type peptidyl-prolyl cis-trans isomerase [Bacteroidales bacterium]|nr:FKBP-type peptidyl-prolyl cis-trans isomerase [Bacteroidales bacterium]MDY6347227.1 FKBP-type peptidyl-prolyl cis-trans isomerase [Bacteroidales bacterium]
MKKIIFRISVAAMAAVMLFSLGSCSKHKGFKKTKSGIYYRFHNKVNDTAYMPQTGDVVAVLLSMRGGDSVLIPMVPQQMIVDSMYEGDIFEAFRMMHVGDSATFLLDGPKFCEMMLDPSQKWEFGDEPVAFDVKLFDVMKKADFEKAKAEHDAQLDERRVKEIEDIDNYLELHKNMKVNESGVYVEKLKNGSGEKVEPLKTVKVHYVGRFTNGEEFDSSIKRDKPFEFTVGAGQVIPGWDAVVSQMRVGDKVRTLIPSSMAYGEGGQMMPPYTPLEFEIELLEVVKE